MLERLKLGQIGLQDHLANWFRMSGNIALTEFVVNRYMQRADVWMMTPRLRARNRVYIYECKISRADYWRDVKAMKYEAYMKECHAFYFAVPKGLISVKELPAGVGLIQLGRRGAWRHEPGLILRNPTFHVTDEQYQRAILRLALGKTTGRAEVEHTGQGFRNTHESEIR